MNIKFLTLVTLLISMTNIFAQEHQQDVNQYGAKVDSIYELKAQAKDGILFFSDKSGNYKFWFDNRVYFDGGYYFDKNAYNEIGNGVTIRRARIAAKAELFKNWYGEIDLDFAGSVVEIKDMYVKYTTDSEKFNFKAGHFKEGFSMETTTTSRYLTFMERSLASKFAPSRVLGLQANYSNSKLLASAGLHFNTIGEAEEVTLSQDANKDFGKDEGFSLTGRVVYRPILDENKFLHIGVASSYRTPKTTAEVPDSYRFSTRSISAINRKKYLDTDNILNVDHNILSNVELAGAYKFVMFQTEYFNEDIYRFTGFENVNLNGFYFQTGALLRGGKYNYNSEEGEFTKITRGKNNGELEVAFRYDYIDLNDEKADLLGGGASAYTAGLNYHFNSNVKLMLNYSYLDHDRYANGKGKLYVGHDVDGNLTKDYTKVVEPKGKGGDDYGQLQMRIEIDF